MVDLRALPPIFAFALTYLFAILADFASLDLVSTDPFFQQAYFHSLSSWGFLSCEISLTNLRHLLMFLGENECFMNFKPNIKTFRGVVLSTVKYTCYSFVYYRFFVVVRVLFIH